MRSVRSESATGTVSRCAHTLIAAQRPQKHMPAADASGAKVVWSFVVCAGRTSARVGLTNVRQAPLLGVRIARGVGVAVPETLHITRLRHVAKAFCLRGERRTLQLRHVVGTRIAPSAGLNEKAFCREARATCVGFGPAVLPQSL